MGNKVTYKLKTEVDGVSELVLSAPNRAHLPLILGLKSAISKASITQMPAILEFQKAVKGNQQAAEDNSDDPDDDGLLGLLSLSPDGGVACFETFLDCAENKGLCKFSDGIHLPKGFLDKLSIDDLEGLYGCFLGNFIST